MRKALVAPALLALSLAFVISPAAQAAPEVEVTIHHFMFDQPVAQAAVGQPIKWTNIEPLGIPHNVVTQAFAPPGGVPVAKTLSLCKDMPAGGKPCVRKDLEAGTYLYTCTINQAHAVAMHGLLVVY